MLSVFVPFWQRVVSKEGTVSSALCTKSPRGEEEEEARASSLPVGVSTVLYRSKRSASILQTKTKKGSYLVSANVPLTAQAPASVDACKRSKTKVWR